MTISIEAKFEIQGQYSVTLEKHDDFHIGEEFHYRVRYGQSLTKPMSHLSAVDEFESCCQHAKGCAGWNVE